MGALLLAWPAELVDLVWPRTCVGCTRPGPALCRTCRGRDVVAAVDDLSVGPLGSPVVAATAYDGGLRRALIAYKERGRHELARPLGALLRASIDFLLAAAGLGVDDPMRPPPWAGVGLVPVPSTAAEARHRGGQHVLRLARAAGRGRGGVIVDALRVTGSRDDSSALGVRARTASPERFLARAPDRCRGAPDRYLGAPDRYLGASTGGSNETWRARSDRSPPSWRSSRDSATRRPVVIVDDIVTSGATARDAIAALTRAGWPVLGVAVVAATPRAVPRLSPVAGRWAPTPPGRVAPNDGRTASTRANPRSTM